jgi:hypothetical protein
MEKLGAFYDALAEFFNIIQTDFKFTSKMVKNTSNCQFTVNVRKIQTESGSVAYMQQLKYSVPFGVINVPEANVKSRSMLYRNSPHRNKISVWWRK